MVNNLSVGDYSVTVMDANGLMNTYEFPVEGQFIPEYDAFGNPIPCDQSSCPPILNLSNTIPAGDYQAAAQINADGVIQNGTNVSMKAGIILCLDNGFEVELGADFTGEIEDCSSN